MKEFHQFNILIYLILYFNNYYAFIGKQPLRNIIISKAIQNSFIENLSIELFDNNILLQQVGFHNDNYQTLFLYITGYIWFQTYYIKINNSMAKENKKLMVFSDYNITHNYLRFFMFFSFFLFFKNVDNAF